LTLRKRGRAGLKSPAASWVAAALKALVVRVDARRVIGELSGCWDRRENRCRLRSGSLPTARCCRLGTAGRLGTERLMRLPGRMCPLGKGSRPGSMAGYETRRSLGEVSQSAFVASASDAEGCGLDCLWPIQSATSRSEIRHVLAAPLLRARPLVGSLHRRGRLQSAGLGERF